MAVTVGWVELFGGVVALLTAGLVLAREIGRHPRDARRKSIRESLEILELLTASPAKADLRASIDRQIIWLVHDEIDKQRSWSGIRDGGVLLVLALVEWLLLPMLWPLWAVAAGFGLVVMIEAAPRKVRSDDGMRLIPQPKPPSPDEVRDDVPMAEYDIGEKPGKGRYCCTSAGCDWSVTLDDDTDVLPPCGRCGKGQVTKYQDC